MESMRLMIMLTRLLFISTALSPCIKIIIGCGNVVKCRLCHDEVFNSATNPKTAHQLDRYKVTTIVCASCSTHQPVSNTCINPDCALTFARYFCPICRLYDDNEKGQWHCEGCGMCRVGGKDNFEHCYTCGFCAPIRDHTCKAKSKSNLLDADCPICKLSFHQRRIVIFFCSLCTQIQVHLGHPLANQKHHFPYLLYARLHALSCLNCRYGVPIHIN